VDELMRTIQNINIKIKRAILVKEFLNLVKKSNLVLNVTQTMFAFFLQPKTAPKKLKNGFLSGARKRLQ